MDEYYNYEDKCCWQLPTSRNFEMQQYPGRSGYRNRNNFRNDHWDRQMGQQINRRGNFHMKAEHSHGQHYHSKRPLYNKACRNNNRRYHHDNRLRNHNERWFNRGESVFDSDCADQNSLLQPSSSTFQCYPPPPKQLLETSKSKCSVKLVKQDLGSFPSSSVSPKCSPCKRSKIATDTDSLTKSEKCGENDLTSLSHVITTEHKLSEVLKVRPIQNYSANQTEKLPLKRLEESPKKAKCTAKGQKKVMRSKKTVVKESNRSKMQNHSKKTGLSPTAAESSHHCNEDVEITVGLDVINPVVIGDSDTSVVFSDECKEEGKKRARRPKQAKRKKSTKTEEWRPVAKKLKLESKDLDMDFVAYDEDVIDMDGVKNVHFDWSVAEELACNFELPLDVSINVVELFEEENTIPFIARYRKEITGDMAVEKLRLVSECYESLKTVQAKAKTMINTVTKAKKMTPALMKAFSNARSMQELEYLYAPFKTNKKTLAERARLLGLEIPAMDFLKNPCGPPVCWDKYVQPLKEGLSSLAEVEVGIQHIIADCIAKDYAVLKCVQTIFESSKLAIECKKNRNFEKKLANMASIETEDIHKFENYYNFKRNVSSVQSHQVLAINRGENLKILSVKVDIPSYLTNEFFNFVFKHICKNGEPCSVNKKLLHVSIKDSYDRFIEPLVFRRVRLELTKNAEKDSITTFATNLRNLLLTSPVSGQVIAAIDPGFTNGCKLAVVAANGSVLHTDTLYLHNYKSSFVEVEKLVCSILKYSCNVIGIGNGTACRETEKIISELIERKKFHPLSVVYCIINESGVSVYSVSDEAAAEFPDMDPNHRSAVSLARRIIDPLSEYIKVDPKHLGVGMYQHDISESLLKKSLDGVIEDCVSFIGVDLNLCSKTVLGKVAGLTIRKADAILKWREENGAFFNREQLRLVPGLGPKTFEQCAGFLRIVEKTLKQCQKIHSERLKNELETKIKIPKRKRKVPDVYSSNLLDGTCIHPESYSTAIRVISAAGCQLSELGSQEFIQALKNFLTDDKINQLASEFSIGLPTMKLIADGLKKPLDYDIRSEFNQPLFKQGVCDINSLHAGMTVSGKVKNVTSFGVFVDIGVGRDGLIHISKLNPKLLFGNPLCVGDNVEVIVIDVDLKKHRVALSLNKVLERSLTSLQ